MGVDDLKYCQTRSEPVLRKMLLLIAKAIIHDIVVKIKNINNVCGLLTDEVTDISNIYQLVSSVKYYDYNKEKAETVFIDCSNLLEFSENSSPNTDATVSCITEKFQELKIKISNLKAFVSDGASVMVGKKKWCSNQIKNKLCLENF